MRRRNFVLASGGIALAALTGCAPATRAGASERKLLETRFGRIAYVDEGRGPAAVFLHGFPLSLYQWRGAIERLAPVRRCIAPDFMGLGRTQVSATQSLAPHHQAAMVLALLDALGVRDFDLVANDSGGAVAQLIVAQAPARVRTLLLTNCDTEHDCPPPALTPVIELARAGRYAEEWLVPWRNDKALARSPQGLGGMCYSCPGQPSDDALEDYLGPLVESEARKALTNRYAVALEHNALAGIEPALRRFTGPVRIVWGVADTIFSADSPAYLDSMFPASRGVRRLDGAKLFFPEEYPDVIAEEARALWAALN